MQKIQQLWASLTEQQLIWLTSLVSGLIAIRVLWLQQGWLNDDSVLYFEMARLFSIGKWHESLALFNWPLYPLLISGLHQLAGFSFELSAQILSVLFFSMTNYGLAKLIQLAGGNKHTILVGSLLLWSSVYITGDVLGMLLRDQGFWAFFLTSLIFFVRFYRSESFSDAVFWQLSAIIATLFRIEAITYLALLPMILFFRPNTGLKIKSLLFLKSHCINLMLLILMSLTILFHESTSMSSFGRIQEVFSLFSQNSTGILSVFNAKSDLLGSAVLGSFIDEYAALSLGVTLLLIVVIKCAMTAGLLPLILGIFYFKGLAPNSVMQADTKKIFFWVALLAILNAIVIIFRSYVLSGRYVIAFGFILLIFAAFYSADLWLASNNNRLKKRVFMICIIIMSLCFIKNIWPKSDGYNFEQDAVRYAQTLQSDPAKVFYVSPRARYYAGAAFDGRGYEYWPFIMRAIENKTIQNYDILVLNMSKDPDKIQKLSLALPTFTLKKVFFDTKKRKSVMIFVRASYFK